MDCSTCTYANAANTKICLMCHKTMNLGISNVQTILNGIQCDVCSYINLSDADNCFVCESEFHKEIMLKDGDRSSDECSDEEYESISDLEESIEKSLKLNEVTRAEPPPRECKICYGPMELNFFAMIECTHTFCENCAVSYFTIQITERSIFDCNCPICNYPDLFADEDNTNYFSLLIACLKPILDKNILNLFEKKLTEKVLSADPNFIWCLRCTSGFIMIPGIDAVTCPNCSIRFCVKCMRTWEIQHDGITCEQFTNWQRNNNPDLSKEAILNYLQKNGIACPNCKYKYDLSRGGCIHFTCTQCKYQFCFGCGKPFLIGASCKISLLCKNYGLHAHHVRNCYYFLRDKEIAELQQFLKSNNIPFITKQTDNFQSAEANREGVTHCSTELQIETATGIMDTICKEPIAEGHAGLCVNHYLEYLILIITKSKLETLPILTKFNCQELLRLKGITFPEQTSSESAEQYKVVLEKLVKDNIALH